MTTTKNNLILVTGASGFLGKYLVEQLVEGGKSVRALIRTPTLHLEKLGGEIIRGDVCDREICAQAVEGVSEIYHLAGKVSRNPDDGPSMYRLHVEGTRTLLSVAAQSKTPPRVVVVSTSGTIAVSKHGDEISNEECPYRMETVSNWPYYLSKIYQEQTAFQLG